MVFLLQPAHRDIRRLKRGQRGAAGRNDDGAEEQQRRRIALRTEAEEGLTPGPQRGSARGGGECRDKAKVRPREAAEGPIKYDVHNFSIPVYCKGVKLRQESHVTAGKISQL